MGTKRVGVYIRTSTEQQADKASPEEQLLDCRAYCDRKNYSVVEVYSDTERYKTGGRVVEPSGTRSDRPQFLRMLKDADEGQFSTIVCWREDRLYRGANRAMLEINERVKNGVIGVELVKETYDPTYAPVKAWASGLELQARHDRQIMGVKARLKSGKAWCSNAPYGYDIQDGISLTVNEQEAEWVRKIWRWFGEGTSIYEIRRRLVAAGAPQKGKARKHTWAIPLIRLILKKDYYYTGAFATKWDGGVYENAIPPIIDEESYQAVKNRFERYRAFPAGNYKQYALAAGLVYCGACGVRMGVVRQFSRAGTQCIYYRCYNLKHATESPGCVKTLSALKVDAEIWSKIWSFISDPDTFEAALQERIEQLQAEEYDASEQVEKITTELNNLAMERFKIVSLARRNIIREDDLQEQLSYLSQSEKSLKHDLADAQLMIGNRAGKLLELAEYFRHQVIQGYEDVNLTPENAEQAEQIFQTKRTIIQGLVTKVVLYRDREIDVFTELDMTGSPFGLSISEPSSRWLLTDTQLKIEFVL